MKNSNVKHASFLIMGCLMIFSTLLPSGCRSSDDKSNGWHSGNSLSDSIMIALDAEMEGNASMKVIGPLVERLDSLTKTGDRQMLARSLFWHARLRHNKGEDSAGIVLTHRAIEACDSARYPYDMARFTQLYMKKLFPSDNTKILRLRKNLDVYKEHGDSLRMSETYNFLAIIYRAYCDFDEAERLYSMARRLINADNDYALLINDFNRAALFKAMGRQDSANMLYRRMLLNLAREEQPRLNSLILQENFEINGDLNLLKEAYNIEIQHLNKKKGGVIRMGIFLLRLRVPSLDTT